KEEIDREENDLQNTPVNRAFSLTSSTTHHCSLLEYRPPLNAWRCRNDFNEAAVSMNANLLPRWHWMFRQTRWPLRFAPQQNIGLSMNGIRIPPWRASAGRLLSDVSRFCSAHREVKNLVLLDPMALSPLSPLLNLMRHSVEPKAHLIGILWMTPIDAISPFYRVPIPRQDEDAEEEVDEHVYPQPGYLRFLTVAAFVSNWLAWFSRIETYSSLGISRHQLSLICESMSGFVLQPWSLGCGQSPLIDLWPLWMARRLLNLLLCCVPSSGRDISRHFFPFTDLDDI
uniref:PRMT5_TIM domain-containing protein n=1 Tax=Mesocestoides corti TaxID=53468 RepID=A0A5K3FY60_MESCO